MSVKRASFAFPLLVGGFVALGRGVAQSAGTVCEVPT